MPAKNVNGGGHEEVPYPLSGPHIMICSRLQAHQLE